MWITTVCLACTVPRDKLPQWEHNSRALVQTKCSRMKEAFKNDHSSQTECNAPLFVILTLFLFHSQVTSVPVRDSWPALKPGVTNNVLFSFSDHQRASSVFWLCRNLQGDDQWRSGKQRRCCGAGYATWKPGLSGQARERGKKWGGGRLRLEVESGVIKIHPTVQTKGGMKKGENAGETREWELWVRKIWGEKKIVSLSRSLNSPPLPKWLPCTRSTIILPRQRKATGGKGESEEEREMDRWRAGGRERERTLVIRQAFPHKICRGSVNRGSTIDSITRQTLQGPYTTTHRRPCSSRAGC